MKETDRSKYNAALKSEKKAGDMYLFNKSDLIQTCAVSVFLSFHNKC